MQQKITMCLGVSAILLAGCGGGSSGGGDTQIMTGPSADDFVITQTNSDTLAAFLAEAPSDTAPTLDLVELTTPGSATYTGFVAIEIPYEGRRNVEIGTSVLSLRTNYQNGPIGAATLNVQFGDTPTVTGRAGNFVAISDADIAWPDNVDNASQVDEFNPADFELDPSFDLIDVDGELTLSGGGIATQRTLVNGVPDDSTARSGLSIRAEGALVIPAGVGGQDVDRVLTVDNSIFTSVTENGLSGSGTVEVINGRDVTRIHLGAVK